MTSMMKSKGGQLMFLGIMMAVMCLIVAIVFIEPIKEQVVQARDPSHLDCTNSSISTGQKATCILTDWYLPYFFGAVVGVGFGFIGMKLYQGA